MRGDGIIKLAGRESYYTDFRITDATGISKQIRRSLMTSDARVAKKRAAALYQDFMDEKFGTVEAKKQRNGFATIGEVIERYESRALEVVRPKTMHSNRSALRLILRRVHGVQEVDSMKVNALSGELVSRYEAAMAAEIVDVASRLRIRTTIASNLRQARSIFDPAKAHWYEGLMLPDLAEFRARQVEGVGARQPKPLPAGAIEGLRMAAPALKLEDAAVYLAFLMFSRLGMRNVEIVAARWNWIETRPDGRHCMAVVTRGDENFDPKGAEGRIPIAADVWEELEAMRAGAEPEDFIVPARTREERYEVVYERHSRWAGRFIKGRSKTSYELRRYAGSLVYAKTKDIMQVKEFLRHSSVETTTKWYAYLLSSAPALEMGDF